jgi:hypothetical protein
MYWWRWTLPTIIVTLALASSAMAEPKTYRCGVVTLSSDRLNIREKPKGKIVGTIGSGNQVQVAFEEGDWAYITIDSNWGKNLQGYVAARYVPNCNSSASAPELVKRAVLAAISNNFNGSVEPEVSNIVVVETYALASWVQGDPGGYAVIIERDGEWQATPITGGWGRIAGLEKMGIPRRQAEALLDRFMPNWRQYES